MSIIFHFVRGCFEADKTEQDKFPFLWAIKYYLILSFKEQVHRNGKGTWKNIDMVVGSKIFEGITLSVDHSQNLVRETVL